jgi:hypothetical protein
MLESEITPLLFYKKFQVDEENAEEILNFQFA